MTKDEKLNQLAIRSFRDTADGDYVAARMAHRAKLTPQFMWAGQQAVERYLKCILMLNRVSSKNFGHNLSLALDAIRKHVVDMPLSPLSTAFIEHIDTYGPDRYLVRSFNNLSAHVVLLDRAVWEFRRYCRTADDAELAAIAKEHENAIKNRDGLSPQKITLEGGFLEKIIADPKHPAREYLIRQNGFFGKKQRKRVSPRNRLHAVNAPLSLHPEILEDVVHLIKISPNDVKAYRAMMQQKAVRLAESDDGSDSGA